MKSPIGSPPASVGRHLVRVGYVDTDKAGVVHHSGYLAYFEAARIEHMRARDLDYRRFEEQSGLALPVVEAHLRYRAPARFDDALSIESWVQELSRAKVTYAQRAMRGEVVLVEARIVLACVNMGQERITSIPEVIAEACRKP